MLRTRATRHWSLLELHRLLPTPPPRSCILAARLSSSSSGGDRHSARSTKAATTRIDAKTRSPKSQRDGRGKDNQPRHDTATNTNAGGNMPRTRAPRTPMPWNFRAIPDTERIEGIEREAAHDLIAKRVGAYSVSNEAFNIKASRMPFREPPPPLDPPTFVRKAMLKYELETASYYQQLRELKKRQEQQSDKDSVSETPSISTTSVLPPQSPLPPKLPPAVLQYQLRNTRQFPPTVDAPHPAFRIGFILSKKMISKLATDRNFGRKKLSAAAEMVFRDHAREGYEYLIFGKPACITTPQAELIELMKKGLNNPALYGEKTSPRNSISTHTSSNDNCINSSGDTGAEKGAKGSLTSTLGPKDIVTIRWMNNRPPLRKTWWKHALPNPLGRVQQSDAYLDRHCVKTPKAPAMSQDRGVQ